MDYADTIEVGAEKLMVTYRTSYKQESVINLLACANYLFQGALTCIIVNQHISTIT